jgi:hypothetical protein
MYAHFPHLYSARNITFCIAANTNISTRTMLTHGHHYQHKKNFTTHHPPGYFLVTLDSAVHQPCQTMHGTCTQ